MAEDNQKMLNILINEGVSVEEDLILALTGHMEKIVGYQAVRREIKNRIFAILDKLKSDSERHKKLLENIARKT